MTRRASDSLTGREAQLMEVLWNLGSATAEQVREALPDRPHDSTVRTLLRVLESKGYVTHEGQGRAYTYRAAIDRSKAQRTALRSLMGRLFGGSAEALVLRLIEDEQLTPGQLDELRQAVPTRRTKPRTGRSR